MTTLLSNLNSHIILLCGNLTQCLNEDASPGSLCVFCRDTVSHHLPCHSMPPCNQDHGTDIQTLSVCVWSRYSQPTQPPECVVREEWQWTSVQVCGLQLKDQTPTNKLNTWEFQTWSCENWGRCLQLLTCRASHMRLYIPVSSTTLFQ